ncbi:MAG TPA: hypothetical protein VF257_14890 [Solirubrobacteraceae bacterium]
MPENVNMTIVWSVVAFIVLVFGGFATPWQTISDLLENSGPSEEQQSVIAFVAGYTLPLTGATLVLVYAGLAGWFDDIDGPYVALICGAVLIGAGLVAQYLGLGLLPRYSYDNLTGPPYIRVPLFALQGYFNTYGWALMLCSGAIGSACAVQLHKWQTHGDS